jgi:transcription initiation factor TFIIH subunit 3
MARERAEGDASLLVLLLETHPRLYDAPAPSAGEPGCALALGLRGVCEAVLVFVNAFLLLSPANRLIVYALHADGVRLLYESPELRGAEAGAKGPAAGAAPTAALLSALSALPSPDSIPPDSLCRTAPLSAGLSRALLHIQRCARGPGSGALSPRILCLSGGADTPGQYVPVMNTIFSAQSCGVPVDACLLGGCESAYLQQATCLTGGVYLRPPRSAALLQYLLTVFAVDAGSRALLRLPQSHGVDFRASCFCHKQPVEIGLVCSVCLSIYCQPCAQCSTCGTVF